MQEKEFFTRLDVAVDVYKRNFGSQPELDKFVQWLYKQYGMMYPKKEENKGQK